MSDPSDMVYITTSQPSVTSCMIEITPLNTKGVQDQLAHSEAHGYEVCPSLRQVGSSPAVEHDNIPNSPFGTLPIMVGVSILPLLFK